MSGLGRLARALPALLVWGALGGCELLIDGELPTIRCSREGRSGPPDCPIGDVCTDHICTEPVGPPMALGSRCDDDAGCAAGSFCLDPTRFAGAGAFATGKKRCSRPCCSSGDCGDVAAALVCAHADLGGAGYCRKASDVERAAPGLRVAGLACAAHADCRSGLCDLAGDHPACVDSCCTDTSCSETKSSCRFGERALARGFWCSPPDGAIAYGEPCATDEACASGLCVEIEGTMRCSAPCCSAAQCAPMLGRPVACADLTHAVFLRACATLLPTSAVGEVGQVCTTAAGCRSGLCGPPAPGQTQRQCTDTCCSDDGCGAPGTFRCAPQEGGPPWPLRCEHK